MQMRVQLAIGLFCTLLGAALLYAVPVVRYDCTRVSPTQVDCRIARRVVWLVPRDTRVISNVVSADESAQSRSSAVPSSSADRRRTTTTTYFHLRLQAADGSEFDSGEAAFIIGDSSQDIASAIRQMIDDPEAQSVSAWQGQWFPMAVGAIFFLFGVLSIYPFLLRPSLLARRDPPVPPQG